MWLGLFVGTNNFTTRGRLNFLQNSQQTELPGSLADRMLLVVRLLVKNARRKMFKKYVFL